MTIYDRGRSLADRQLGAKGQLGAIRRTVTTGGGASDPTGATENVTDYPVNVALFPVDQRDIDGTFIKAGDWRALVSTKGLTITPTTTDAIVASEGLLSIVDPGKFAPDGTVTHYNMLVRLISRTIPDIGVPVFASGVFEEGVFA